MTRLHSIRRKYLKLEETSQRIDDSQDGMGKEKIKSIINTFKAKNEDEHLEGEMSHVSELMKKSAVVLKLLSYVICFACLLGGGVISKGTLLFMTSQLKPNTTHEYCTQSILFKTKTDYEMIVIQYGK